MYRSDDREKSGGGGLPDREEGEEDVGRGGSEDDTDSSDASSFCFSSVGATEEREP